MPFLRAGRKKPKPEPEELKQEESGASAVEETSSEIEPAADNVEPAPENEPVADTVEPALENEPVADTEEASPENEPVSDTEGQLQENVPAVETEELPPENESVPENEPVSEKEEALPENEPVADTEEASPENESVPENEPVSEKEKALPENEPVSDTEGQLQENVPVPDTSGLPAEILEAVADSPSKESPSAPEPDSGQDTQPASSGTDYSGENLKYDFTSGERYVDKVSTKTEFDKMLDELANISKDLLSWQVEKFAKQHTGKFQGDFDKAESDAKKYEAFLGGYITNAAMTLYDNGYRDIAIKQLEQAKSILEARKKLEEETEATRTRVAENEDVVDLTDILGLFGD